MSLGLNDKAGVILYSLGFTVFVRVYKYGLSKAGKFDRSPVDPNIGASVLENRIPEKAPDRWESKT